MNKDDRNLVILWAVFGACVVVPVVLVALVAWLVVTP